MAAQVLLLLLVLFPNVHAEVIRRAGGFHRFFLDQTADFCSVSRWTGEGKELLWNSSASNYEIHSLNDSHSGQYLEQCWTRGNLTLQRNSTLLVCGTHAMSDHWSVYPALGQTVELNCDNVGPNQSVQWAYGTYIIDGFILIDDETPSEGKHQRGKNNSLLLTVDRLSESSVYYCLEKKAGGCDIHSRFDIYMQSEFLLRSVGESLELNCSDVSGNQRNIWKMLNLLWSYRVSLNNTLMFPSLTLGHTGGYHCQHSVSSHVYYRLFVCPESKPPAVVHFTGGENLILPCGYWNQTGDVFWFMRSNTTEGRVVIFGEYQRPENRYASNLSLEIRNVSLQDSGEFWCVAMKDDRCVFRSETLVMFRQPEVDHHLVRSVLLSVVMLMMLCVVVVVSRSRKTEQLPAPMEELEMSQLSPESDVLEETPV